MSKTHYRVPGVDARSLGQTEFQYSHQTACGYVRDNVTTNGDLVDCKLCLRSEDMKHYHQINGASQILKGAIEPYNLSILRLLAVRKNGLLYDFI